MQATMLFLLSDDNGLPDISRLVDNLISQMCEWFNLASTSNDLVDVQELLKLEVFLDNF